MPTLFRPVIRPLLTLLFIGLLGTGTSTMLGVNQTGGLRAQIRISRQVIATSVFSSTPEGNSQRLKMTASAGEVFVGTKKGEIRATVGFQQPDDDVLVSIVTVGERQITIKAFPNPTIDRLTVDLGDAQQEISEVQLLDLNGRVMVRRLVLTPVLQFPEVIKLPGGTYFLRGLDRNGLPLNLGTILITPH